MRVTVFGGSGFIGGALADNLRAAGHEVHTPARAEIDAPAPAGGHGRVVWAAGLTAGFRQRPFETVEAHVSALSRLLARGDMDGMLYLSSTRVYQEAQQTREDAALPALPGRPEDLYNLTKLTGEAICLATAPPGPAVARLSNVVGPNEARRNTFLGALCREARDGYIRLRTGLDSEKDYIWIDDAVSILARLALGEGVERIYNVARGTQISHREWVAAIGRETGSRVEVEPDAPTTRFPPIDTMRMTRDFAAKPVDPLDRVGEIVSASA